jgi:hypothetical protein
MEEAPENGKESPHSAHANRLISYVITICYALICILCSLCILGINDCNLIVKLCTIHHNYISINLTCSISHGPVGAYCRSLEHE